MSLSHDKDNHYIPRLTRANWTTWIEYVRDYIYALDADDAPDIWNAFKWVQPEGGQEADPADKDYQQATNANAKKLRTAHNKAYKFIRQRLSADVFEKTKGQEVNVPKLLRFLRKYWFDGSVSDRNRLRLEFEALRLGDYADMDLYIDAFKAKAKMCRGAKIGMAQTDDDVLFRQRKFACSLGAVQSNRFCIANEFGRRLQLLLKDGQRKRGLAWHLQEGQEGYGRRACDR